MSSFEIKKGKSTSLFDSNGNCILSPDNFVEGHWYLTTDTAEVYVALRQPNDELVLRKINECNIDVDFDFEDFDLRLTALEAAVNGAGEGDEHVAGLVEKVAALEAVDNATQAELDAYKEVVTKAITDAVTEVKKYADDNDADTVYDDTALSNRVKALEDKPAYDETPLSNRVTVLETTVGTAEAGLVKDVADNKQAIEDEKARAEAAEKALGERIDSVDFIDQDELDAAIQPLTTEIAKKAAQSDLEALEDRVDAFLTGTGATDALDSLQELIEYINTHDDTDINGIVASIEAIEKKLEGVDSTVAAYVAAAIDAIKIGDYAKAADLTALAGRVEALESKPFDDYATKTELGEAVEGIENDLAKKADASSVYTKTEVDDKIGVPGVPAVTDEEGNEITPAVQGTGVFANAYSRAEVDKLLDDVQGGSSESADSVLRQLNTYKSTNDARVSNIETKNGEQDVAIATAQARADQGFANAAQVASDLASLDTKVVSNTNEIADLKTAVADHDAAINAIIQPKASTEVTVADDGTLGLGEVSTDKLVQGILELIINGGSATTDFDK